MVPLPVRAFITPTIEAARRANGGFQFLGGSGVVLDGFPVLDAASLPGLRFSHHAAGPRIFRYPGQEGANVPLPPGKFVILKDQAGQEHLVQVTGEARPNGTPCIILDSPPAQNK